VTKGASVTPIRDVIMRIGSGSDIAYVAALAVIAESFPGHLRYSGASLGYQLASITAGGPAPIVALWLQEKYHSSTAVAGYLALCALVSLVALRLLPERKAMEGD
jgi:MFS family permease